MPNYEEQVLEIVNFINLYIMKKEKENHVVMKNINKMILFLILQLFITISSNCKENSQLTSICPLNSKTFFSIWNDHSSKVKEIGIKHAHYKIIYSYLLPDSPDTYFYNQCLPSLNNYERGKEKGKINHYINWMSCLKYYYRDNVPKFVKHLSKCQIFTIKGI